MSLASLRDLLARHFNNDELRRLCFDLTIEYEDLPGDTRIAKAQSLVEYGLRHNRLPDLGTRCRQLHPAVNWPDVGALAAALTEVQQTANTLTGTLQDESLLAAMLIPLRQQETNLLTQLIGSGALALGAGAVAVGERGVNTGRAELIITGDNNSVQTIIHHYGTTTGTEIPDPAALLAQIGAYLTWLLDWAGTIELRGIQRQGEQVVQLPLEKVYVPLAATTYGSRENSINLNEVLSLGRRLILTGGPGSGKTTVLLHIAWALTQAIAADDLALAKKLVGFEPAKSKKDDGSEEIESLPLPIFVPLSAYAVHRRSLKPQDDRTLAAFITHYLFARQTSFALPDDFFRHLLRQGRAVLLLLDGLDEVPDETERAQVRQAIEDLVTGREGMRVVVTCRSAAYQGRSALGRGFRQVTVRPLAEEHIAALVGHAYAHLYRADPLQRQQKTVELLAGITRLEAERQARLIDSPLLVRMLLIVHYRERRLPEQRAELYMKATDAMLLPDYAPDTETADAIGQLIGGSWEVHRDLVQHLAFHMHQRGAKQGREIEESDLRRLLAVEPAYAPLVDDFVKLTRLRGTLLEERFGSYRFLHLAFQEYLTARYLAEIVRSDGGIQAVVAFLEAGPLLESWWREVILLVAGYFGVASPQTAQSFLERLAGIDPAVATRPPWPPEQQMAAAELAAVGWLEWPAQREELRQRLANRLAALFADTALMSLTRVALRAAAGQALAQLGDHRPGVGFVVRAGMKIPDIAWGEEVPAGKYTIGGDKEASQATQKLVTMPHPYRLSRYPITYAQFQCFVDALDVADGRWWAGILANERQWGKQNFLLANHPCVNVSWYQAVAFCRWLSDKLGYRVELPHEYEWEVAARWPDNRFYPWGSAFDQEKANTNEGGIGQTTAVGIYPSGKNVALELYDLSGNVWEWCRNRYDEPDRDLATDEVDISNTRRVVRGGAWNDGQLSARAAYRLVYHPADRSSNFGFRVGVRRSPSHGH